MAYEKFGTRFQENDAATALGVVGEACTQLSETLKSVDPDARIVSVDLDHLDLQPLGSEEGGLWHRLKVVVDRTNEESLV